jgi:hypothetical protein
MLTGVYPPTHGVRTNTLGAYGGAEASGVATLTQTLKARGYGTGAFVSGATLRTSLGLNVGFDTYDSPFTDKIDGVLVPDRDAGATATRAASWIRKHRETSPQSPYFAFVHFFDPHAPYGLPGDSGTPRERYLREIEKADAGLGIVLAQVDLASTIVVITSDHGEGLGDHGEETHSYFLYDSTLHVPLIISAPQMQASQNNRPASLVDITPTVRGLLGLSGAVEPAGSRPIHASIPTGIDLFGTDADTLDRVIYAETVDSYVAFGMHPMQCACAIPQKLIWSSAPDQFDVVADPSESASIYDANSERSKATHAALRKFVARFAKRDAPTGAPESVGGYYDAVHLPAMPDNEVWNVVGDDGKPLDAPTQRTEDIRTIQAVNQLLQAGDIDQAIAASYKLAAARTSMVLAQQLYCTALAARRTQLVKLRDDAAAKSAAGTVGDQALVVARLQIRFKLNADNYRAMAARNFIAAGRLCDARALLPQLPAGEKKAELERLIAAADADARDPFDREAAQD